MHLSTSQRAALAVLMLPEAAAKAKVRQLNALKKGDETPSASSDANGKAAAEVAEQMNVSERQVERAARVKEEAPEAFEKIKEGKATVAGEHAKLPKKTTTPGPTKKETRSVAAMTEATRLAQKRLEKLQRCSLSLLDGVTPAAYASTDIEMDYYVEALTDVRQTLCDLVAQIQEAGSLRSRLKAIAEIEGTPEIAITSTAVN
jgi:hypothetical protein